MCDVFYGLSLLNSGSHLAEIPSRSPTQHTHLLLKWAWGAIGPAGGPQTQVWPLTTCVFYFQDAFEQGQVFLGSDEQGYQVYEDLPKGIRGNRWKAGITIVTPQRRFIFTCPSEKEQREWMESFRDVLSRPLTPLNLLSKMQGLFLRLRAVGKKGLLHLGSAVSPETGVMAPECPLSIFFSSCQRKVETVHIIARKPSLSTLSSSTRSLSLATSGGVSLWQSCHLDPLFCPAQSRSLAASLSLHPLPLSPFSHEKTLACY